MELWEIPLVQIDGGYRVREAVTGEHHIEVHQMLFNWRVVRSHKNGSGYDMGFCYQGTDVQTLCAAIVAAMEWDGEDDTEPAGYFKRACLYGKTTASRGSGLGTIRLSHLVSPRCPPAAQESETALRSARASASKGRA